MNEVWKDILGFEGKYQVSNLGRIKSLKRKVLGRDGIYQYRSEKLMTLQQHNTGYVCVSLRKNNKRKSFNVHRLVAKAFIPNPENKPEVNHGDGDKSNNHVDNLEWTTKKRICIMPLSRNCALTS